MHVLIDIAVTSIAQLANMLTLLEPTLNLSKAKSFEEICSEASKQIIASNEDNIVGSTKSFLNKQVVAVKNINQGITSVLFYTRPIYKGASTNITFVTISFVYDPKIVTILENQAFKINFVTKEILIKTVKAIGNIVIPNLFSYTATTFQILDADELVIFQNLKPNSNVNKLECLKALTLGLGNTLDTVVIEDHINNARSALIKKFDSFDEDLSYLIDEFNFVIAGDIYAPLS